MAVKPEKPGKRQIWGVLQAERNSDGSSGGWPSLEGDQEDPQVGGRVWSCRVGAVQFTPRSCELRTAPENVGEVAVSACCGKTESNGLGGYRAQVPSIGWATGKNGSLQASQSGAGPQDVVLSETAGCCGLEGPGTACSAC